MSYYDKNAYLPTRRHSQSRSVTRPTYHSRLQHEVIDDVFVDPPQQGLSPILYLRDSSLNLYSIINKFEALHARSSLHYQPAPQTLCRVPRTRVRNEEGTQIRYKMDSSLRIRSLSRRPVFDGNSASRMSEARHFSGSTMGNIPFTSKNASTFGSSSRNANKFMFSPANEYCTPARRASRLVHETVTTPRSALEQKRITVREIIEQFDIAHTDDTKDFNVAYKDHVSKTPTFTRLHTPILQGTDREVRQIFTPQLRISPIRQKVSTDVAHLAKMQPNSIQSAKSQASTSFKTPTAHIMSHNDRLGSSRLKVSNSASPQRGRPIERTPFGSSRSTHPPVSGKGRQLMDRIHEGSPTPLMFSRPFGQMSTSVRHTMHPAVQSYPATCEDSAIVTKVSSTPQNYQFESVSSHKVALTQSPSPRHQVARSKVNNIRINGGDTSLVAKMKTFWEANTDPSVRNAEISLEVSVDVNVAKAHRSSIALSSATGGCPSLKNQRNQSNVSPKTIPKQSTRVSAKLPILTQTVTSGFSRTMENAPHRNDGDKDGPSDSMSPTLQVPHTNSPLTTVLPLFYETLAPSAIAMMPPSPAASSLDGGGNTEMPTSTDIQHIYAEVEKQLQKFEARSQVKEARAKKRKTFVEKWNLRLPGPILEVSNSTTDGILPEVTRSEDDAELIQMNVIVKEADCEVKEPKPLRITELQSIMLLCRGRTGIFVLERAETV